jgi:tetratricopeptide (TPR) repeat protein
VPFSDRYGNELTTTSEAAAASYSEGIDRALAGNPGAEDCLQAAIEADEGFALAHIDLARLRQFQGRVPEARQHMERAQALAGGLTRREQDHITILSEAIAGNGTVAVALTREHLRDYPRDAFILNQSSGVYGLIGFSGSITRNDEQLALLQGVEHAYGDDWWFLSALGVAHEESGDYATARGMCERSLQGFWRNGHAAHVLAHVYFETGDPDEGTAFLDGWVDGYEREAQLYTHIHWHRALFLLGIYDYERAMAIYEENIRPGASKSAALGIIADTASFLWRCQMYGYEGDLPWHEASEYARTAFPRRGVTFADVHCALAYAGSGDTAALGTLIDSLRERQSLGKIAAGEVVPALAEGAASFAAGDYAGAVRILEPVADEVVRIGGSHAQREIWEDTLCEAYLRAGQYGRAKGLLEQRLSRRPSLRDLEWLGRAADGLAAGSAVAAQPEAGTEA